MNNYTLNQIIKQAAYGTLKQWISEESFDEKDYIICAEDIAKATMSYMREPKFDILRYMKPMFPEAVDKDAVEDVARRLARIEYHANGFETIGPESVYIEKAWHAHIQPADDIVKHLSKKREEKVWNIVDMLLTAFSGEVGDNWGTKRHEVYDYAYHALKIHKSI
jgi:hypothetical protein